MPNTNIPDHRTSNNSTRRRLGPGVTVTCNGNRQHFTASDLEDIETFDELHDDCLSATSTPVFRLRDLPAWDGQARWNLLDFIAQLDCPCEIRLSKDGPSYTCLFDAVLQLIEGDGDVTRCENSRRAAIEAAALIHPESLGPACHRIAQRLREVGVRGVLPQTLLKEARNVAGKAAQDGLDDPLEAAARFHAHLNEVNDLDEETPAIRFFQDEFYLWTGRTWLRTNDKEFAARVMRFLQEHGGPPKLTARFVSDVLANLRGMTFVQGWTQNLPLWVCNRDTTLGQPSPYAVFQNGMLDVTSYLQLGELPELLPADPQHFGQVVLPFAYDPAATCPRWLQALDEILPRISDTDHRIEVLQEFMGWTLIPGDTSFEKFLIAVGKGSNGKTTLLKVWTALLGQENVSHVPLEGFSSEFRPYEMVGKLANLAGDMNHLDKVQEGLLKSLTSGDPIQVNRKNKDPITMRPTARLIFATNSLPSIADRSNGTWRRMIAMPFLVEFSEAVRDRRLDRELLAELPGIFLWALEGARRLYRQDHFTPCSVCTQCVGDHRFDSDPFLQFIHQEVELGPEYKVMTRHLYEAYRKFCEATGRRTRKETEFGKQVLELEGVAKIRLTTGSRPYQYTGIRLARADSPYSDDE